MPNKEIGFESHEVIPRDLLEEMFIQIEKEYLPTLSNELAFNAIRSEAHEKGNSLV